MHTKTLINRYDTTLIERLNISLPVKPLYLQYYGYPPQTHVKVCLNDQGYQNPQSGT